MLEYIGYAASVIVLISLLMSSVKKLRWINLFGSFFFVLYGFLIKAYPIAILNIFTVSINIYYIIKMANTKTYFKILEIDNKTKYLEYYLSLHQEDLMHYFDVNEVDFDSADLSFYILRDIIPAGVFSGKRYDSSTLLIQLDYVSPPYRDFSLGKFLYETQKQVFTNKGFTRLITFTNNTVHMNYLLKMGFSRNESLDQTDKLAYQINL
jgi:hypothetical protein